MTTRNEFVEMWNKTANKLKTVVLKNKKGWIRANKYDFESFDDQNITVELYSNTNRIISMIDIKEIYKVL